MNPWSSNGAASRAGTPVAAQPRRKARRLSAPGAMGLFLGLVMVVFSAPAALAAPGGRHLTRARQPARGRLVAARCPRACR